MVHTVFDLSRLRLCSVVVTDGMRPSSCRAAPRPASSASPIGPRPDQRIWPRRQQRGPTFWCALLRTIRACRYGKARPSSGKIPSPFGCRHSSPTSARAGRSAGGFPRQRQRYPLWYDMIGLNDLQNPGGGKYPGNGLCLLHDLKFAAAFGAFLQIDVFETSLDRSAMRRPEPGRHADRLHIPNQL